MVLRFGYTFLAVFLTFRFRSRHLLRKFSLYCPFWPVRLPLEVETLMNSSGRIAGNAVRHPLVSDIMARPLHPRFTALDLEV